MLQLLWGIENDSGIGQLHVRCIKRPFFFSHWLPVTWWIRL